MDWRRFSGFTKQDELEQDKGKHRLYCIYPHTQGNGKQVETIRAGQTIRPVGNTQGEGASYLKREES